MGPPADAVQWQETSLAEERQRRLQAIAEYTRRLIAEVKPACIILFGSMATGVDRIESDVDIVVIGGELPTDFSERFRFVGRLRFGIPVSIDIFPYTEGEFERMLDNLHVTALDCLYKGIPLHGKEYFERLRLRFQEHVARGLRRDKTAWYFEKKAA